MKNKVTLVLDIGNSETRALVEVGPFKGVQRETSYLNLSNAFARIYRVPKNLNTDDYTPDNSIIFTTDAQIGTDALSDKPYAHGLYAEREHTSKLARATANLDKFNSKYTALSIVTSIYHAAKEIKAKAKLEHELDAIIDSIEWDLTLLLPPEQAQRQTQLKEDIMAIKQVNFIAPDFVANINITRVTIQQEGYTAYYGALLDRRTKQPYAIFKDKFPETTLILDIGAGTSDFMVVQGGKAIEVSKKTVNIGGNNIVAQAHKIYSSEEDLRIAEQQFEEAVRTGVVQSGTRDIDVAEYINEAKFNISETLIKEIRGYLTSTQIEPTSLHNMLVVGGASLSPDNPAIDVLGHILVEEFKKFAPDIELIDLNAPSEDFINGKDELVTPRTVNLIGAGILTDIRDLKEQARQGV